MVEGMPVEETAAAPLPSFLEKGLPKLWGFTAYDAEQFPYLLSVSFRGFDSDRILDQVPLFCLPAWRVVGFHAGAPVEQTRTPDVVLLAARRPNPQTLHAAYLNGFLRAGGESVLGPAVSARDVRLVREVPAELAAAFAEQELGGEELHLALHIALEEGVEVPLASGWSHLLCPATPLSTIMDILRSDRVRHQQWQLFTNYSGDMRSLEVEMAARLAAEDPRYREPGNVEALEELALTLTEDD